MGYGISTDELRKISVDSLRKDMLEVPMYARFADRYPREFEKSIVEGFRKVSEGQDIRSAMQRLNSSLLSAAAPLWETASDQAMDAWLDFMILLVRENVDVAPRETLMKITNHEEALKWGASVIEKLPRYPIDQEHLAIAALFAGPAVTIDERGRKEAARRLEKDILPSLFVGMTQEDINVAASGEIPRLPQQQKRACEFYLRLYQAAKEKPLMERANIARAILWNW